MSTIDSSIVNVALPTLQQAFDASMTQVGWVSLAYLVTLTVLLLPFGRLGDRIGRRPIYLSGLVLFVIGSALCGLANSAPLLIAARVVQGVGASMVSANAAAIITATFPAAMRGRALGSIGAVVGLGLTVGPPVGGWLLTAYGWPSIFFVNLPIGAIAIAMGLRLLPREDGAGAARPAAHPMLDLALFRDRVFSTALAGLFLSFVALFSTVFLAPFYLENVTGLSPAQVGQVLVVVPLMLLLVAPFAGALSDRLGTRRLATAGLAVMTLGMILLATLLGRATTQPAGVREMVAGLLVIGLGQGLFQPPNASAAMGAVPVSRLGQAGGLVATMRNLGMVVGIGLAAVTFEGREAAARAAGAGLVEAAAIGMRDTLLVGAVVAAIGLGLLLRTRPARTIP